MNDMETGKPQRSRGQLLQSLLALVLMVFPLMRGLPWFSCFLDDEPEDED